MACPSSLLNGTDFEEIACKWPGLRITTNTRTQCNDVHTSITV